MRTEPDEILIKGTWSVVEGVARADKVCQRIEHLIADVFTKVADGNWEVLYRDPADGRFWELTWPQSHLHGGGPPQLQQLDAELAHSKYSLTD